ncbi:MAG: GTPase HflX [Eubacterium sp.]|nr:GTPase HflX [Eubacterium sp.]
MLYETEKVIEKVILVGIDTGDNEFDTESCLDELGDLAKTAGAEVVGRLIQKREAINKATYLGKGKIEELKNYIEMVEATGIICDDELNPNQIRNLENTLDTKVMNRTLLILDIFAKRASSAEGKVQVELAQLKYNLSHLTGRGKEMSRLGGGIGTRGPGEKKLETDRRNISDRISDLNKELKEIERHRGVLREKRMETGVPVIALVGYTNAGKSTLLNTLTGAGVLAENMLFATLDTTTRAVETDSGAKYLFTDTVGFIQKLPHNLIKAFKATLEEAKYADILVHVVDASNPKRSEQMNIVYKTLKELGADDKPVITVYNKIDKEDVEKPLFTDKRALETISISAKNGLNINTLLQKTEEIIKSFKKSIKVVIPYNMGQLLSIVHGNCEITDSENREDGYYFELYADEETENRLRDYIVE